MDRLTERDEYGNADIVGVDSAELQLNLEFDDLNKVTDALNRLAAYEDTGLTPEQIEAQQQEIDRLNKEMDDICTISARRLGQIAAMREALEQFKYDYEQGERMTGNYYGVCNILRSTDPIDYHNPADTERIENLEYTLIGVMHSVDKWFDEVDERLDEVTRAAQAREIALQAIEHLTADKDEQAGRLMQYDTALKQAREALARVTYIEEVLPEWEQKEQVYKAIAAIDKVIGGKEDVKRT